LRWFPGTMGVREHMLKMIHYLVSPDIAEKRP
jgi:hypothetical protein